MKQFVKVDFWVQVILYALLIMGWATYGFNTIFYFLISMGIWQLFSAFLLTQIFEDRMRRDYLKYALFYLMLSPFFIVFLWLAPFVYSIGAFGFSIWYSRLTYFHHRRLQTTFRSFWDLEI